MEPFSVFKVSWQPLASKHTEVDFETAAQNWKTSTDGRLKDRKAYALKIKRQMT